MTVPGVNHSALDDVIAAMILGESKAYDNVLAESFWATLQTELLDRQDWKTRSQLRSGAFDYTEAFYKRRRLRSALG